METGLEGKPWFYGAGVAVVLTVALPAAVHYIWFQDMIKQITKQEETLESLQDKIREGEAAKRRLPQFMEEVDRLDLDLDKLLRILPSNRKTEEMLRRMRTLTEQGDFLLVRFNPRPLSRQDDFYSEWAIQVELEGTYHNTARFFDRVGNFARIINIENLKITPRQSRISGYHSIRAQFMLKTFLSNEEEEEEDI